MKKWEDLNQYERLNPMHNLPDDAYGLAVLGLQSLLAFALGVLLLIWSAAAVMAGSVPASALAGAGWFCWWRVFLGDKST